MKKTSIDAHESIKPVKPTHWQIILAVFKKNQHAMTAEEVSKQITEFNYWEVQRRLKEMERRNLIECTPILGKNEISKRSSHKWRLKNTEPTLF